MTLAEILAIAEEMFQEGFTRAEAYPLHRWKRNKWPEVKDPAVWRLMDVYIQLAKLKKAYGDG